MPTITTSDGRTLHWNVAGSGPPLLLHPGGPGASAAYFGELPELAAERSLVLLDPRGTGGSDRPADPSGYDLAGYADDIEAVREELGIDRLDLLGHSHGGFVAMAWAGRYPERVGRLILAGTTARFTDAIRARRQAIVASHAGRPYFDDALAALRDEQAGRYANDAELIALFERAGRLLAPVDADIEPVAAAFRAAGINADALRHFNDQIAAGMDLRPLLARITAPTLVLAAGGDPFDASTAEIAAALADRTIATIPGAGHFAFLEPAGRAPWSRAVLDFLAADQPR